MNCTTILSVKILFELASLHTREAATQLMDIVRANECNTIELDFEGIEFISRSFADQFHKERLEWWLKKDISIPIVNANTHIISTLQSVANTQSARNRKRDYIPRYKFTNQAQLEQFLMDI